MLLLLAHGVDVVLYLILFGNCISKFSFRDPCHLIKDLCHGSSKVDGLTQETLKVGNVSTALRGYVENVSELRLRRLKHEGLLRCSPANEAVLEKNLAEKLLQNCVFYFILLCSRKCS